MTGPYSSFSQLLSHASAGALYPNTDLFCHQLQNYNAGGSNLGTDIENHETTYALDGEGYEAGEDSPFESESAYEDEPCEDFDGEQHSEDGQDFLGEQHSEDGQDCDGPRQYCVTEVNDDIPMKKFENRGFMSDFDDDKHGIDDTVFSENEVDMEVVELADAQDDSVPNEETGEHNEEISQCLLGDCGCAQPEIAQEISQYYTESTKAGYKKRKRESALDWFTLK